MADQTNTTNQIREILKLLRVHPGIKPEIAEVFRLLRVHHSMKQVELAKAFGVNPQYTTQLERGRKSVTLNMIQKYSDYFNIPVSSIIYIAEHLPLAHPGERRQSPCSHAARILDIEWSKQDLRCELVRKQ